MIKSIKLFIYEVITFSLEKLGLEAVGDYRCHIYCKEGDWE